MLSLRAIITPNIIIVKSTTEGLRIMWILGLEKTALHKIHVSGTAGGPLLTQKSPTCAYIVQNRGSRGPR